MLSHLMAHPYQVRNETNLGLEVQTGFISMSLNTADLLDNSRLCVKSLGQVSEMSRKKHKGLTISL
jgi:hypothetical protein